MNTQGRKNKPTPPILNKSQIPTPMELMVFGRASGILKEKVPLAEDKMRYALRMWRAVEHSIAKGWSYLEKEDRTKKENQKSCTLSYAMKETGIFQEKTFKKYFIEHEKLNIRSIDIVSTDEEVGKEACSVWEAAKRDNNIAAEKINAIISLQINALSNRGKKGAHSKALKHVKKKKQEYFDQNETQAGTLVETSKANFSKKGTGKSE